jgi:hypothetical protein
MSFEYPKDFVSRTLSVRPIPWCVEHNSQRHFLAEVCYRFLAENPEWDCEFSWGGPDHRWWEDEPRQVFT